MPVPVGRGEVQALLEEGAWLLDVLEDEDFDRSHLPDAVHIPLTDLRRDKLAHIDPHWPVVVYGAELSCDRSARAARLLEHFGFSCVYVYEAGKRDWMAYGLPVAGTGPLLATHLMQDTTCVGIDQPVFMALEQLDAARTDFAVVVDAGDIVLGTVTRTALTDADPAAVLLDVMEVDPVTARPNDPAAPLARALDGTAGARVLVTTASGRLLGVVTRSRLLGSGRTLASLAVPA
ncbi:MAG TPA: rhodanese-like domain-containing protein [Acidimicrobiales bacterium]|nr:rhodanese-like domain-containing protein [Acidimicrobiales bacterium]